MDLPLIKKASREAIAPIIFSFLNSFFLQSFEFELYENIVLFSVLHSSKLYDACLIAQ
jgi:hypothetical protein